MIEPKLEELIQIIERELEQSRELFHKGFSSKRLERVLAYALGSKGKRLRPLMVMAAALSGRKSSSITHAIKRAIPGACAVEYVHTYSLIHDDLPCMDDDDYRRGRFSVHRQFDEGIAVLAGDALLADAFLMASSSQTNAVAIIQEIAKTAGSMGLVSGQAEDLVANVTTSKERWFAINEAKTARLFEACAVIGGLSVDASRGDLHSLREFGRHFGAAFQIKDDSDDQNGVLMAEREVKTMLEIHLSKAHQLLSSLDHAEMLRSLLHFTFATAFSSSTSIAERIRSCSAI